jgi:purine-binding chemotaxis protein CheW
MSELMTMEDDHHVVLENEQQYVTMTIDGQLFGMPIMQVEDIVEPDQITMVPLAPCQIAGVMNLRGRVVTVIDLKQCLGGAKATNGSAGGNGLDHEAAGDEAGGTDVVTVSVAHDNKFSITVEKDGGLYTLLVDKIGDVRALPDHDLETTPTNLDAQFRRVSSGVYRLKDELLVVLDVDKVFELLNELA